MGLTERHWFENEDVPENYEWALEDAVRANKKVIALLKEQKQTFPTWKLGIPYCNNCGERFSRGYKYCPGCGKAVKWDG